MLLDSGKPRGNSCRQRKNMQMTVENSSHSASPWELKPKPSCCVVTELRTQPLCRPHTRMHLLVEKNRSHQFSTYNNGRAWLKQTSNTFLKPHLHTLTNEMLLMQCRNNHFVQQVDDRTSLNTSPTYLFCLNSMQNTSSLQAVKPNPL